MSGAPVRNLIASLQLRPAALCLLFALLAVSYIAHRSGVSIEAVQMILFPLFLFAFWQLPARTDFRMPPQLVILALGCWGFSGLNIRGYLPVVFSERAVLLATLEQDSAGQSRDLFRRYNVIADAYALPKMKVLLRSFDSAADGESWTSSKEDVSLVVSGTPEWLRVHFPARTLELPAQDTFSPEWISRVQEEAKRLGVTLDGRARLVSVPGIPVPFVLALVPETLYLPGEPSELSRHYLGWLARASGTEGALGDPSAPLGANPRFEALQRFAYLEDAASQTTMMLGAWKSPEPISLGRFLLGTLNMVEAFSEPRAGTGEFDSAAGMLNNAMKMLRKDRQPILVSLIRNNLNLLRLLKSETEEDLAHTRRQMLVTASITDADGNTTTGARLSMLNLILLEEAGVL